MPKKGKKGVEQRIKGNVKAASSGRMADLLASETASGFIGFEAVSKGMMAGGGEVEGGGGGGGVEEVSHGAGAAFQVVLKQLGKRDTTTKLKALQEFTVLCESQPVQDVVSVLNLWSLMYSKLSTDNDNRVREASHKALASCVSAVRASLSPHLPSLLGCWVAGMCDPYSSAASAAQSAFSAAFSSEKQTEVLKFGFKAILKFVEDIILKQTSDSFSDPKIVPEDERIQRYERIVFMSLYGLSLTLRRLPGNYVAKQQEKWEGLLGDKKLWKLSRHHNPQIRAASFSVLVSLCEQSPDFVVSRGKQFCSLVLGSLGENEPVVIGPLWEATLLVIEGNKEWSHHVNIQKALLPGLWRLLSEGGYGSARLAFPCLLNLLRKLVEQVYPSDTYFAISFLEKLKSGLQSDSVRCSKSECETVLQTFHQTFLYLMLNVATGKLGKLKENEGEEEGEEEGKKEEVGEEGKKEEREDGEGKEEEDERKLFIQGLLNLLVEILDYSATQCPKSQSTLICGWVGRILDDVLSFGSTHLWIASSLNGWFRDRLASHVLDLLKTSSDKDHLSKVSSLLSSLGAYDWRTSADRRVTFTGGGDASLTTPTSVTWDDAKHTTPTLNPADLNSGEQSERNIEIVLNKRKSFLTPIVASALAHCVFAVCGEHSVVHCSLLIIGLQMYGCREVVEGMHMYVCDREKEEGSSVSQGGGGKDGGGKHEQLEEKGRTEKAAKENVGGEGETEGGGGGGDGGREIEGSAELGREGRGGEKEGGGREGGGGGKRTEKDTTEMILSLCTNLLQTLSGDSSFDHTPQLIGGVVSCVLLLLGVEGVRETAVRVCLERVVMDKPCTLPLLLTTLGIEKHRQEWAEFLIELQQSQLLKMVGGGGGEEGGGEERGGSSNSFLEAFLDDALTNSAFLDSESGLVLKVKLFETVCTTVQGHLHGDKKTCSSSWVKSLLSILSKATPQIVKESLNQSPSSINTVLESLLTWCLHNYSTEPSYTSSLLPHTCSCYTHLTSLLPHPTSHLISTALHLTTLLETEPNKLQRALEVSVLVRVLFAPVLKTYDLLWTFYLPLLSYATKHKENFFPLATLEFFCSSHLYSPFSHDLSSDKITSSLSGPRLVLLLLSSSLCSQSVLSSCLKSLSSSSLSDSFKTHSVSNLLEVFEASGCGLDVSVIFPVQEEDEGREKEEEEKEEVCFQRWKDLVCELLLALCALRPSANIETSAVDIAAASILQSSLYICLGVGLREEPGNRKWCHQLLQDLIDKASLEGPLWCLALEMFICLIQEALGEDPQSILTDLISMVFIEPKAALALATLDGLSGCGLIECEGCLKGSLHGRETDICLLSACLSLLPTEKDALSLASAALSKVALGHSNSQLPLFDSLEVSIQDPMTFSLLQLISKLCRDNQIPENAWEFILCSLVTITQFLSEATPTQRCTINYTVFHCKAMTTCTDVTRLLSSPDVSPVHSWEWNEFFHPDLEQRLLPMFLSYAAQSMSVTQSYCHVQQNLFLCKAVSLVCSNLSAMTLEQLVNIIMSSTYPFKVAALLLSQRYITTVEFCIEETAALPSGKLTVMRISSLKTLLGESIKRVNLDLAFLEEQDGAGCYDDKGVCCYDNTSSYLILWLLIIEIMSNCGAEARASLGEWLKELSLFPHLLLGLFHFLDEEDCPQKKQIEVTLCPNLKTLCVVLYSTIALHLPSMLRVWYLSLDRATSATVARFTTKHISPALHQTELQSVAKSGTTHGSMEVRVFVGASEVSVIYRVHEFSIELFVYLPDNYPLQPPSIREGKRVRVEAGQWRKWMLQLNVFVGNQNGTLLDGLLLWRNNLDKHFSGIEDCMICFSVIHGSVYSLPKMTCRTCKKKFHSACLYKWFNTSNKSTCPLCRNIF